MQLCWPYILATNQLTEEVNEMGLAITARDERGHLVSVKWLHRVTGPRSVSRDLHPRSGWSQRNYTDDIYQ